MSAPVSSSPLARDPEIVAATECLRTGKAAEAVARLEPLADTPNPAFEVLYLLGMAYAQSGMMEGAERRLEQAVALNPRHAQALFNLGQVLARTERPEEARALFQRALAADPGYARARQALDQLGPAPDDAATQAEAPPGMTACPQCGTHNPEGYFACTLCGRPAERRAAPVPAPAAAFAPAALAGGYSPSRVEEEAVPERSEEEEKRDVTSAAMLAGGLFLVFALVNSWKMASKLADAGPAAFGIAILVVVVKALVPFVASVAVFTVMANLGNWVRRLTAAAIIAAARVGIEFFWVMVFEPIFGKTLDVITLGLGDWLVYVCVIYITTLTVIEKVLDTHLEYAHTIAMAVVVATGIAWIALTLGLVAAIPAAAILMK